MCGEGFWVSRTGKQTSLRTPELSNYTESY